ncbi:hypothetical protein JW964_07485 [candidate division KSB1 bacterium]|nr:hypothetical protein [candidate division KSB1 bacterium]
METTKCIGKVMRDGHLSIPLNIFVDLGLMAGDEIELILKKYDGQKLAKRKQKDEKISYTFPEAKQKRLSELLFKNREGEITEFELAELERLVFESQLQALEKAKALYEQRNRHGVQQLLWLKMNK